MKLRENFGQRIGWLVDGIPETPLVPCVLTFTAGAGITIEVPLAPTNSPQHIDWFGFDENLPDELTFADQEGAIRLLGVYGRGFKQRGFITGAGLGRAGATYAVIGGAEGQANNPQSVRSEIQGLHEWLGWTGREERVSVDEAKRVQQVDITLRRQEPIAIEHDGTTLTWELHWVASHEGDNHAVSETTYFSTTIAAGAGHAAHLRYHRALRDLMNLSTWTAGDYLSHAQRSEDSPARTIDGRAYEIPWRPVLTVATRANSETEVEPAPRRRSSQNAIFRFADLGASTFVDWLALRDEYERAYSPLLSLIHSRNRPVEEAMLAVGIALEAIGYIDALGRGETKTQAKSRNVADRISLLARGHASLLQELVGNVESWSAAAASGYNSVKHANRTMAEPLQLHLLWQSGVWLVRLHLADRLGLKELASEKALHLPGWGNLARQIKENAAW